MIRLLRAFDFSSSSWEVAASLCYDYSKLYGVQIVLVGLLSALTVYRREISCNHVYNESESHHPEHQNSQVSSSSQSDDENNNETAKEQILWTEETAEELLEGAGNYCSGEPLLAVALSLLTYLFYYKEEEETDLFTTTTRTSLKYSANSNDSAAENDSPSSSSSHASSDNSCSERYLTNTLPYDVQIHVLSYLHPKELVSLACCSKSCRTLVDDDDDTSHPLLWKTLWRRDYGWLLTNWSIGRQALQRSARSIQETTMNKTFYFVFGQAYTNYVLAGCNTAEQCLVSLHGHIYDLTPFLNAHPGSPDTLMVHAGREATRDFERMNHSSGARKLARSLCVIVGCSNNFDSVGVSPTRHTTMIQQDSNHDLPSRLVEPPMMPMGRKTARPQPTRHRIRSQFQAMEAHQVTQFTKRLASNTDILGGHINVYYDPFQGKWKAWYTNLDFETVFVE